MGLTEAECEQFIQWCLGNPSEAFTPEVMGVLEEVLVVIDEYDLYSTGGDDVDVGKFLSETEGGVSWSGHERDFLSAVLSSGNPTENLREAAEKGDLRDPDQDLDDELKLAREHLSEGSVETVRRCIS